MKYLRLYADEEGESHVGEMAASFAMADYAPPAPAFGVSPPVAAARYIFVDFPAGWTSGLHPAPRRQLFVVLSGRGEGGTSTGQTIVLGPGDVLLMEDTTGRGHSARALDGAGARAPMVHLE